MHLTFSFSWSRLSPIDSDELFGRPRSRVALLLLIASITTSGCQRFSYKSFIGHLIPREFQSDGQQNLKVRLTGTTGRPLRGVKVWVASRSLPYQTFTDDKGIAGIPIREQYIKEDPKIGIGRLLGFTLSYNATTAGSLSGGAPNLLSTEGKRRVGDGQIAVFYDDAHGTQAQLALASLAAHRQAVFRETGLEPVPWSLLLIPDAMSNSSAIVLQVPGEADTWPFTVQSVISGSFTHMNVHEWTEATIGHHLSLHEADRRNRCVVDGIAEYVAFGCTGRANVHTKVLQELMDSGEHWVNLLEQFQSMRANLPSRSKSAESTVEQVLREQLFPPGYFLSFAIWHELGHQYGGDLPRKLLVRLKGQRGRSFGAVESILIELTGEQNIRRRFEQADVRTAIDLAQRLGSE